MIKVSHETKELLIVSVTPQNLERGELWFSENAGAIQKALHTHPWWRDNAIFIEKDLVVKPSLFTRRLMELGYERASGVYGRGLFAVRGGLIEVWPVNASQAWLVEFEGNRIGEIAARQTSAEKIRPRVRTDSNEIEKLVVGAFVVHADHGIGIYRGISEDFFSVEYASPGPGRQPDRLLVPRDARDRLTPYIGFDTPHIHRLGGTLWLRTRRKIKEEAEKLARELLALYTSRAGTQRPPYQRDLALEEELRATFPYQETPDQLAAEEDIMRDFSKTQPMDRILCGDVGFGKTEVAIRAALAAVASGKQMCVLAPTTVLAAQHEKTFSSRLAGLAVTVRMLSRLTPPREQLRILTDVREGKIDCVIGTHRLLSEDIAFKNLGLVVIDEEQRFGVKQKERFKEMRSEVDPVRNQISLVSADVGTHQISNGVDILSLSATPIPRTMQFAMAKLKDISLLSTPPPERIPIETLVLPYTTHIIREAITSELARGGQVYFLHNRIETIGKAKEKLASILARGARSTRGAHATPRIGVIHGHMSEQELIAVMERFRNRELDILLATTIIENGLDISSANTLIVDDATRLGLAQAHQLRGRIGRGAQQAFAYFLYKPRHLTPKAAERLAALQEYADLGSGYHIALRDLEIRGAGNILGREQSGAINKVGLNLYCQILTEAVEEAKIAQ